MKRTPTCLQSSLQLPVEPLDHPIGLGVESGGGDVLGPHLLAPGRPP